MIHIVSQAEISLVCARYLELLRVNFIVTLQVLRDSYGSTPVYTTKYYSDDDGKSIT